MANETTRDFDRLVECARALGKASYIAKTTKIPLKKLGFSDVLVVSETESALMSVVAMLDMSRGAFHADYMKWINCEIPNNRCFSDEKHGQLLSLIADLLRDIKAKSGRCELTTPEGESALLVIVAADGEQYQAAMAKIAMMLNDAKDNPGMYGRFLEVTLGDDLIRATVHGLKLTEDQQRLAENRLDQLRDIQQRSKSLHRYQVFLSCWNKVRAAICW